MDYGKLEQSWKTFGKFSNSGSKVSISEGKDSWRPFDYGHHLQLHGITADFFPYHPVQEEKSRKTRLGRQRTAQIMSLVGQNMCRWEDTCQTKPRFSCCREVGGKIQPMPEETGGILMAHPTRKDLSTFIHRPRITRNYPYTASIMV